MTCIMALICLRKRISIGISLYGQPDYKGSWIKRNFTDTGDKCCSRSSTMNPCDPFSSCRCLYQTFHPPENPDTDMGSKKLRKDITTPKRLVHTKHAKSNVYQWLLYLCYELMIFVSGWAMAALGCPLSERESRVMKTDPFTTTRIKCWLGINSCRKFCVTC